MTAGCYGKLCVCGAPSRAVWLLLNDGNGLCAASSRQLKYLAGNENLDEKKVEEERFR
jgi:hypothetical protein